MSDDDIPARIAALDKAWEWVSDAPSRLDTIASSLSDLSSRLDKISGDDVNKKVLELVEGSEKALPDLTDQLKDAQRAVEDATQTFDKTSEDLNKRFDAIKSQVGG